MSKLWFNPLYPGKSTSSRLDQRNSGFCCDRPAPPRRCGKPIKGYSLVELLIAIAIIGIVASAAVPAYSAYNLASRQALAGSKLSQIAISMEHFYGERRRYPADLEQIGVEETSGWYQYSIDLQQNHRYTLTATPVADKNAKGVLSLDHTGRQQYKTDADEPWQPGWP